MEDKAKCYDNMSHCYLLWQSKYKEALEAAKKSIECSVKGGNWPKAYLRCSAAYVKLNQPGLAALTLKKGLAMAHLTVNLASYHQLLSYCQNPT